MQLTIKVPVKPHVKKYLVAKYGETYKLSQREGLGVTLFQMLRNPREEKRIVQRQAEKYVESYTINVTPYFKTDRACTAFNDKTITQVNSFVEDMLLQEFYGYVENLESFGIEQKEAIAAFMAKYDFDETDVKYEALKKSYQRYRIKQNQIGRHHVKCSLVIPYVLAMKAISSTYQQQKVLKKVA